MCKTESHPRGLAAVLMIFLGSGTGSSGLPVPGPEILASSMTAFCLSHLTSAAKQMNVKSLHLRDLYDIWGKEVEGQRKEKVNYIR